MLLTVHEEGHFLALDDHSKVVPLVGHHGHQEGGGLVGHLGARLRVVEDDPLAAVLHAREPQAQVDDLLEAVRDGKEHTALGAAGLHPHADGEVPEEGGRDEGPGRAADVGTRPKAVGWEATIASNKGHRGGQRDTDELREVQGAPGSRFCGERRAHASYIRSSLLGNKEEIYSGNEMGSFKKPTAASEFLFVKLF